MQYRNERAIISGMIFLLGTVNLTVHLYHLIREEIIYQVLPGTVSPVIVSGGLMASAFFFYRSPLRDRYLSRLLGWVLGGAVTLVAMGGLLILYQESYGSTIDNVVFVLFNMVGAGGLVGSLIGYYDGLLQQTHSDLETERDRLSKQQAILERQNNRLDQFAQIVSHDLRNPLNVARGRIELAQETDDMSELASAVSALERMDTIIEDMLAMARYGQTVEEDDLEAVSLTEMAKSSWRAVDSQEASLQVTGDVRFDADRSKVQNVFENLFRNAIEHGGADVTVSVGPIQDGSGFYVEDDGIGLASSDVIFEPGYTTNENGTGLGLAVAHDIITAHDWRITAGRSARGGARFEIEDVNDK